MDIFRAEIISDLLNTTFSSKTFIDIREYNKIKFISFKLANFSNLIIASWLISKANKYILKLLADSYFNSSVKM